MYIKKDFLYKISLLLLLTSPIIIQSVEINIMIISFFTFFVLFDSRKKYSRTLIQVILPLIILLIIAIFTTFFYPLKLFESIKDFFFLIKPVLYIILGYYLLSKIKDKSIIFRMIIYAGLVLAIIHLIEVNIYLTQNQFDINRLRNFAGRGNAIEVFAFVFLFSSQGKKLYNVKPKQKRIIQLLILCSFIFYFSRTVTVSVIVLFLAIKGYLTITRKGLLYMTGFIILLSLFYAYLFSIEIDREDSKLSGFFYKIKIAPSEIFTTGEIDVNNHQDLWDHWRAYEAQRAFEQLGDTPYRAGLMFGKGLGSLVDLGFVAHLDGEGIQYITTLHNGYAYIMYKAGFAGVLFFFLFLLIVYSQVYRKSNNFKSKIICNLISGFAIYYMFTTLIVTGIYNPRDFGGLILGAFIFLNQYYESTQAIED